MCSDTNMSDLSELTPVVERGMGLHKMIRFVSFLVAYSLSFSFRCLISPDSLRFLCTDSSSTPLAAKATSTLKETSSVTPRFARSPLPVSLPFLRLTRSFPDVPLSLLVVARFPSSGQQQFVPLRSSTVQPPLGQSASIQIPQRL
jgi:hypothetical protein